MSAPTTQITRANCSRTPVSRAAMGGHEGVVKILLGRDDVNLNEPDRYGQTPLCWAAENGHAGVVKILLGWGNVNPDKPDKLGRTPLWWASQRGHADVIALLQPPETAISGAAY